VEGDFCGGQGEVRGDGSQGQGARADRDEGVQGKAGCRGHGRHHGGGGGGGGGGGWGGQRLESSRHSDCLFNFELRAGRTGVVEPAHRGEEWLPVLADVGVLYLHQGCG
jgi:hypothetical protein